MCNSALQTHTVEQDISADTLFPRFGNFTVPRILIFADAGTEHSSFIVIFLNRGNLFSQIGCQPRK